MLFEEEKLLKDIREWTVLMCICRYCPFLLDQNIWFISELFLQAG